MRDLEQTKNAVLVDNTAQAVFKHLDRIRDNRALLGTRWIWELLQNARDVATETGVIVRIDVTPSHLTFRHDGRPFESEDIAHLIYHGSTKVDLKGPVGRYGSGFISTHLLSSVVRLRGQLSEDESFNFVIDRSGASVHELSEDMEKSWRAFEASVQTNHKLRPFTAEFEYPLDEQAHELVSAGLSQLEACASLVLAFSPEIVRIEVQTPDASWSMARSLETPLSDAVSLLEIDYWDETSPGSRWVAFFSAPGDAITAVPLTGEQGALHVALTAEVPRLYVLFPMVTTERLALPAAISSLGFKPREDRDGIALHGEAEGPSENRRILDEAAHGVGALLRCAAEHRWQGIEPLVSFDLSNLPDWVQPDWYVQLMQGLLEVARSTPLVVLQNGERIAPEDALIPHGETDDQCLALANFGAGLKDVAAKLPRADLIPVWSSNILYWAQLLRVPPADFAEVLTLRRIAERVAAASTLERLQSNLVDGVSAVPWLAAFIHHLREHHFGTLFDELALLPDQRGTFRHRTQLKRDMDIDEGLKEIAAALEFDLRPTLLDPRIQSALAADFLLPATEEHTLAAVIQHLQECCDDEQMPRDLVAPGAALFAWTAVRPHFAHYLRGFPVPSADEHDDSVAVIAMSRHPQPDARPIAPPECWPSGLQPFASLFPRRKVLNKVFLGTHLGVDAWEPLERLGLVTLGPVYRTECKATLFVPDEFTTSESDDEHESVEAVSLTQIAYLTGDDFMVIDTIRKSSPRAAQFIQFLSKLAEDSRADPRETIPVQCVCGHTHQAYCAAWLESVRSRTWVPLGADGKRASKLSAESLAELLVKHPTIVQSLAQEHGNALLTALEISPADFMLRMVAQGEDARVALIRSMSDLSQAAGGDLDRIRELVHEISEHPEILLAIEQQRAQRQRVSRNQHIGGLVEQLLEAALTDEELHVRRTGVGSDYVVDSDLVEDDQEILLEVMHRESATLVEIKSTRTHSAKMTPRQAQTARGHGQRFALCVVELGDAEPTTELVRERCRFVFNIGAGLQSPWTQYESIQQATTAAAGTAGPITIEVIEGQYRFMVRREVWEAGLTFQQAVAVFRREGAAALV